MRTGRAIAPPRIPRGRRTAEDSPAGSENRPANPSEWKIGGRSVHTRKLLGLRAIAGPRSEGLAPTSKHARYTWRHPGVLLEDSGDCAQRRYTFVPPQQADETP